MTLALAGKTQRRRTVLVLAAFISIIISMAGGASLYKGEGARADPPTTGEIQVHKYLPKENPPESAPWQNQGNGQGKWEFQVYSDAAGTIKVGDPYDQLGSNSGDQYPMNVDLWIKETDTGGDTFTGFFFPDNIPAGSGGNAHCNQQPLDGSTLSNDVLTKIPKEYWNQSGNQTGLLHICAYNKPAEPATGTVIVMKVITSDSGDTTTMFSGTLMKGSVNVSGSPFSNLKQGTAGAETFSGLAMGTYDLVETPLTAGFNLLGYKAGSGTTAPTCPAAEGLASSISATLASAGEVKVLCVYNEAVPEENRTLRIGKVTPTDVHPAATFTGTFTGGSFSVGLPLDTHIGAPVAYTVGTGAGTVTETGFGGWLLNGYMVIADPDGTATCPVSGTYLLGTNVVPAGNNDYLVCISNEYPQVNILRTLYVEKVIVSSAPDNTAHFTGTVSSQWSGTWDATNGQRVMLNNQLPEGTYTAHEDPKSGYALLGFKVVGSGACPAAGAPYLSEGVANLTGSTTLATVCVYNQALGSIEVTKTTVTSHNGGADQPAPQDRDGWRIVLTGCSGAENRSGFTGVNGKVLFEGLRVCSDYLVAEDLTAPGAVDYVPVGSSSVGPVTPANPATQVNFVNRKSTFDTFTFETPVPVPPTPVPPTPVPPTPVPPTPVIDVVLGEKTPDVLATPIAPVTGNGGPTSTGGTFNILFVLLGTAILGGGFALASASRRNNRN